MGWIGVKVGEVDWTKGGWVGLELRWVGWIGVKVGGVDWS